jgi:hypothetical protein
MRLRIAKDSSMNLESCSTIERFLNSLRFNFLCAAPCRHEELFPHLDYDTDVEVEGDFMLLVEDTHPRYNELLEWSGF